MSERSAPARSQVNPWTFILLAAGGLIAFSLFKKASGLGTLNFYADGIKDINFINGDPIATINLTVQNTSNQEFQFNSFAGQLYTGNLFIGMISSFTPTTIHPNSQITIPFTVRLSLIDTVNTVMRAFQLKNIKMELSLQAYANIDNLQLPLNLKYQVGA